MFLGLTVNLDLIIVTVQEVFTWRKGNVRSVQITFTATQELQIVLLVLETAHQRYIKHSVLADQDSSGASQQTTACHALKILS